MNKHNIFVGKAIKKFGNRYDYTFDVYIKNSKKMTIKCNTCSTLFYQTPANHLYGYNGCTICALQRKKDSHTKSQEQCILDFKSKHRG